MSQYQYTTELVNNLTKRYKEENATIEELSEEFQIPRRNLIAKLSSMGIYKKKPYLSKTGQLPVKKENYIVNIAQKIGIPVDQAESLEKVNKRILVLLAEKLSQEKFEFYTPDYLG